VTSRPTSESSRYLAFERDLRGSGNRVASLARLHELALRVFLDRNCAGWNRFGMPKRDREKLKAEVQPFLRESITCVRKSRDALVAGDIELHELWFERAHKYRLFAALEFYQRYANQRGEQLRAIAGRAPSGGKAKAQHMKAERSGELDRLIEGCLQRGERCRVKAWCEEHQLSKSAVYRRIDEIKKKSAQ
jgi:hypothetical protein